MLGTVTMRLLEGMTLNCLLFFGTLVAALPLGLVVAFGSMSRFTPLRWLTRTFVWVIRSTPLLLQIIVIYYGPGLLWNATALPRINAALIAFIINYAAYFSEIYRGGIQGIPRGQYEAGQVLGMTKPQIFFKIILLQVIKRILPPMSNEVITLVKDTSLARVIAIKEIIMVGQEYISSAALIWPLFYTAVFFLVFCGVLQLLFDFIERKMSYFRV